MYMCTKLRLYAEIPARIRPLLGVRLRQLRGVAAASTDGRVVTLYYQRPFDPRSALPLLYSFEKTYGAKQEERKELEEDFSSDSVEGKFTSYILDKVEEGIED